MSIAYKIFFSTFLKSENLLLYALFSSCHCEARSVSRSNLGFAFPIRLGQRRLLRRPKCGLLAMTSHTLVIASLRRRRSNLRSPIHLGYQRLPRRFTPHNDRGGYGLLAMTNGRRMAIGIRRLPRQGKIRPSSQ